MLHNGTKKPKLIVNKKLSSPNKKAKQLVAEVDTKLIYTCMCQTTVLCYQSMYQTEVIQRKSQYLYIWMPNTCGRTNPIVGSRIEVPCAIQVLEVFKVFSYRFEDAKSNERGLTSGKCGELSLEGVFQNGGQNTLN